MIESIAFKDFLGAKDLSFHLGRAPVVLITAGNGLGKSRILDALAWCLWGKTLRKVNPGPEAWARVVLGGDSYVLRGKGVKGDVVLVQADCEAARGKTKVQEPIAALVGEERAWLRALYLKGQTVAAFAGGSDTERFAHLEFVTGVWRLNAVYDAAREAATAALQANNKAAYAYEMAVKALRASSDQATSGPVGIRNRFHVRSLQDLEGALANALREATEAGQRLAKAEDHTQGCNVRFKQAQSTADDLRRFPPPKPLCGACQQPLKDTEHAQRIEEAEQAQRAAWGALEAATKQQTQLQKELAHAKATVSFARSELDTRLNARALFDQAESTYYRDAHKALMDRLAADKALEVLEAAKLELAAADLAKRALSNTGARMEYLSSLLGRIELRANRHLAHLGDVRVGLTLQGSKLQLATTGIGAPDYASASSGQQRRVDIALLLAMSEIAAEVGTLPTTAPLVIDEAFDTLDTEGVSALVSLACDIAKQRQVFLVSHAEPEIPMGSGVLHIRL